MLTLIKANSSDIWIHNDGNDELFLSLGYFRMVDNKFELYSESGGQLREALLSDIIVRDDSQGGGNETFTTALQLITRLRALSYPFFPDSWGDSSGAVDSVFGRTGVVIAEAGDYNASQITNDSTVFGTNVDDALQYLASINSSEWADFNGIWANTTGVLTLGDINSEGNSTTIKLDDANNEISVNGTLAILDSSSSSKATFNTSVLSSDRIYTFPDKAGTFAMLDDIISSPNTIYNTNDALTSDRIVSLGTFKLTLQSAAGSDVTAFIIQDEEVQFYYENSVGSVSGFSVSPTQMLIEDSINEKGLQYNADYSANFTDRSLVDKAYVDSNSGSNVNQWSDYAGDFSLGTGVLSLGDVNNLGNETKLIIDDATGGVIRTNQGTVIQATGFTIFDGTYEASFATQTLVGNITYTFQDSSGTVAFIDVDNNFSSIQTFSSNVLIGDGTNPFSAELAFTNTSSTAFPVVFSSNNNATGTQANFYGFTNVADIEGVSDTETSRGFYNRLRIQEGHTNRAYGFYNELDIDDNGTDNMLLAYGQSNLVTFSGTETQTVSFLLGFDQKVTLENANATYSNMYGHSVDITVTNGTIDAFAGLRIDLDQAGGTISDGAYLYFGTGIDLAQAQANGILVIESDLDLPSFLAGGLEAKEFIKTGATSDDILLGDGSTTSLSGIPSSSLEGYTETGTRAGGDLVITLGDYDDSGTAFKLILNTEDGEILVNENTNREFKIDLNSIKFTDISSNVLNINYLSLTGNRTISFPDASGTIALTSDIEDTSEWATFTGTRAGGDLVTTLGDYDIQDTGTRIIIDQNGESISAYHAGFDSYGSMVVKQNAGLGIENASGTQQGTIYATNITGSNNYELPDKSGTIALTSDELQESNVFSDVFEGNTSASISLDISSYRSFILTVNQNTVITTDTSGLGNSKSCSFSAIVTGNFTVDLSAYTISPSSDTYDGTIDNRLIFDVYKKSNGTTIQIVTVENLS